MPAEAKGGDDDAEEGGVGRSPGYGDREGGCVGEEECGERDRKEDSKRTEGDVEDAWFELEDDDFGIADESGGGGGLNHGMNGGIGTGFGGDDRAC